MNEVVVLNDPGYLDHGLECRMIGAEIRNDERGACIAVEIIVGGLTNQYRFHDVYEFMRMWRLADSVVLPDTPRSDAKTHWAEWQDVRGTASMIKFAEENAL